MKTPSQPSRPLVSQTNSEATLWVGHVQNDPNDHLAGQTFRSPDGGTIDTIQVLTSAITQGGELELTLFEFDESGHRWGNPLGSRRLTLEKKDSGKWISFSMDPVQLEKGTSYGFRLHTDNGLIGLGEAVSHAHRPFPFGEAWSSHMAGAGHFYRYFSLAFKVELRA